MIRSKAWAWQQLDDRSAWEEPAEEIYYLAQRWIQRGFLHALDLGAGLGRHSVFLARAGFSVDAFDLSEDANRMLEERCDQQGIDSITTAHGDMHRLPYDESVFDCIVAYQVVYHTDRKGLEDVAAEVRRVLKPGGEVFVTFNAITSPQLDDTTSQRIDAQTLIKTTGVEAGIPHYYTGADDVREIMSQFSFIRFTYQELLREKPTSCQYHLLAAKQEEPAPER